MREETAVLDALWKFLAHPANRDVLTWMGGGFAVIVGGIWAVFTFFAKKPSGGNPPANISADYGSVAAGGDISGSRIITNSEKAARKTKP